MSFFRLNVAKFVVACLNFSLTLSFFFSLRRCLLRVAGVKVGRSVTYHRGIKLFCLGRLSIGDLSTVNYQCFIDARGGVDIGRNVNISHCVRIYTMGHDLDSPDACVVSRPVSIGDNAWIFPNVLIMPGVTVGEGAVVYPGSVVTKSLDAYGVYAGNPAKKIRDRTAVPEYKAAFPVWFAI